MPCIKPGNNPSLFKQDATFDEQSGSNTSTPTSQIPKEFLHSKVIKSPAAVVIGAVKVNQAVGSPLLQLDTGLCPVSGLY